MGRKRLTIDEAGPLPEGLFLHGRKYRARLPGGPWQYFGSSRDVAIRSYAQWLQSAPPVKIDVDRAAKIKQGQREKKITEAKRLTTK